MKRTLILIAVLASACGHPTTPSAPLTLALAGQSNALRFQVELAQAYAPGRVVGFAQDGSMIRQWALGTPFWNALAPTLHEPLRAFVWWQGESDRDDPDPFSERLREFFARVRAESGQPMLRVVLCRVVDDPLFAEIREMEERYARSDPLTTVVSSDGLPLEGIGSAHLSVEGYRAMAQRVLAVLP